MGPLFIVSLQASSCQFVPSDLIRIYKQSTVILNKA